MKKMPCRIFQSTRVPEHPGESLTLTSAISAPAWFAGTCSRVPVPISKLHLAKHIGSGRGVKVCYAPVKICKDAEDLPDLAASGTAAGLIVLRPAVVAERTAALLFMRAAQGAAGRANTAHGMLAAAFTAHGALAVLAMTAAIFVGRVGHIPGPRLAPGLPPTEYRGPMYRTWVYSAIRLRLPPASIESFVSACRGSPTGWFPAHMHNLGLPWQMA